MQPYPCTGDGFAARKRCLTPSESPPSASGGASGRPRATRRGRALCVRESTSESSWLEPRLSTMLFRLLRNRAGVSGRGAARRRGAGAYDFSGVRAEPGIELADPHSRHVGPLPRRARERVEGDVGAGQHARKRRQRARPQRSAQRLRCLRQLADCRGPREIFHLAQRATVRRGKGRARLARTVRMSLSCIPSCGQSSLHVLTAASRTSRGISRWKRSAASASDRRTPAERCVRRALQTERRAMP